MRNKVAKPFIKWAGGKGQLLSKFLELYPQELLSGQIERYIEPFVGGGAVLFEVLQKFELKSAVIIDINKELINCYRCVKENLIEMLTRLEPLQERFYSLSQPAQGDLYSEIRERFNAVRLNGHFDFDKAADFIFLNRTCFNGLYRVNSKGEFNVPFGRYKKPVICDRDNLALVHALLQRVEILCGDYRLCRQYAVNKAFVYFDPPYRPITQTQSFVRYSENGFNDDNQRELAQLVRELDSLGAKVMLSNSDPKNANSLDNFFDDLYEGYRIIRINAKRMINCKADKRGEITEIIVTNY